MEKVGKKPTVLARLFIVFVRGYQVTLRPFLGRYCRFEPSCSDYAIGALTKYGGIKGGVKATYRILRCNPFGGSGHDPP